MSKKDLPPEDNYEDEDSLIDDDDEQFFDRYRDEVRFKLSLESNKQKEKRAKLEAFLDERRLRNELSDLDQYDIDD